MATSIRGKREAQASAVDPVCGKSVDPKTSPKEQSFGKQYSFCSEECREKFKENPSEYSAA